MASTPRSPGPHPADDGVEVGPVAVEVGARRVGQPGDLDDVALEQAAGVGVGDHHRRHVGAELGREVGEIDPAVGGLGDLLAPDSRRRRRWPDWCRGPRSGPAPCLPRVAPGLVRGADGQQAAELAVRARPWATAPRPACRSGSSASGPASSISASAPCTVDCGCSGWMSAKPGRRAIFSLSRGLCFMVHEPSG